MNDAPNTVPPTQFSTRTVQRSLASIVLCFEAIVVFLAALVIFGLGLLPAAFALGGGALLCVLLFGNIFLLRFSSGFLLGWVMQFLLLLTAFFVPLMLVVVALFGTMWVYCMVRGAKIDREKQITP